MATLMQFRCGHEVSIPEVGDVVREFVEAARDFDCPICQQEWLHSRSFDASIFVNMQRLSPGLVAYVVEVPDVAGDLRDILKMAGYVLSRASHDELTLVEDGQFGKVWRKEYWFADDTPPQHAVALLTLLKQEIAWLATYLPQGGKAVHYWDFPA
jgi:hypothetical protein